MPRAAGTAFEKGEETGTRARRTKAGAAGAARARALQGRSTPLKSKNSAVWASPAASEEEVLVDDIALEDGGDEEEGEEEELEEDSAVFMGGGVLSCRCSDFYSFI